MGFFDDDVDPNLCSKHNVVLIHKHCTFAEVSPLLQAGLYRLVLRPDTRDWVCSSISMRCVAMMPIYDRLMPVRVSLLD